MSPSEHDSIDSRHRAGRLCADRDRQLRARLAGGAPWIDVRAPREWVRGSVLGATNLPLLDDDQRRQIGIRYRAEGQAAAIALGNRLVAGAAREQRMRRWAEWVAEYPEAVVYCARGGLRSGTVVDWLAETGCSVDRVDGGYQRIRRVLLEVLEEVPSRLPWLVVSGSTGAGKTEFLQRVGAATIDLEGLAHHRGSAFGAWPEPQPRQATFENHLAQQLLALEREAPSRVLVEDESRLIGERRVPPALFGAMQRAPIVALDAERSERVDRILSDYVLGPIRRGRELRVVRDDLLLALQRIRRALGGARHARIEREMTAAWVAHEEHGDTERHREWIEWLCVEYYDPYYERHLARMHSRVIARGNREQLGEVMRELAADASAKSSA